MEEKYGIKELKELLDWVFTSGRSISKAREDGKINMLDFPVLIPLISKAGEAFGGIQQVTAELLDISEAEKQELRDYIEEEFDIVNDRVEELIKRGISIGLDLYTFALELSKFKK